MWVDDDGSERYPYEVSQIEKEGYEVVWARSGQEAELALTQSRYEVILLDQQLPWHRSQPSVVWGGVFLLAWLSGSTLPEGVPFCPGFDALFHAEREPVDRHDCPVLVVSASEIG